LEKIAESREKRGRLSMELGLKLLKNWEKDNSIFLISMA